MTVREPGEDHNRAARRAGGRAGGQSGGQSGGPAPFHLTTLALAAGVLGLCPLPGRGGDYAGDLAHLVEFGPDLVLSLVQIHEYPRHNAPTLTADLAAMGIPHIRFEVRDFGTPDSAVWQDLSPRLHGALGRGQRVVIHCLGGCGRTGTIALRLMVEAGEDPAAALVRLRAARPCAVETAAQLRWATTQHL